MKANSHLKKLFPETSNRVLKLLIETDAIDNAGNILDVDVTRSTLSNSGHYPLPLIEKRLEIIYEDSDSLVINKPSGVRVEPGSGTDYGLVNYVTWYINKISNNPFSIPRPIHRLDKDTSGLILFSKSKSAHTFFSKQFKNREIQKAYQALVEGNFVEWLSQKDLKLPYVIETYISKKPNNRKYFNTTQDHGDYAKTEITQVTYSPEENTSKLHISLHTGRTHQIRVHLSELGFPIVGDRIYSNKAVNSQMKLTSCALSFRTIGFEQINLSL